MIWLIGFRVPTDAMLRVEISKRFLVQQKIPKSCIFKGWHLANGNSESNNSWHFLKVLIEIFQWLVKFYSNCDWFFAVISRKYKKWAICDILITTNLGVNTITRQMTPFFSSILWFLSIGIFHFCISRPSKFNSIGVHPFSLCSDL